MEGQKELIPTGHSRSNSLVFWLGGFINHDGSLAANLAFPTVLTSQEHSQSIVDMWKYEVIKNGMLVE